MSISSAVSAARYSRHSSAALTAIAALGILVSSSRVSAAQTSAAPASTWEFRVTSGAFVPTGNQRNFLKDAELTAAQLSWVVRPSLAVTGTFGWARSRDLTSIGRPKLDVFTYDLGVETRAAPWFAGRALTITPFAGLGAGVRSYNYRKLDVDATNNLAGYASLGGDVGIGRVGLRLEARDYASGYKPLVGEGKSETRNDVVLMAALRFNFHRASQD